jgi:hypothetical protein
VREFRLHGFGRGAVSNDRPYRASARAIRGLSPCGHRLRSAMLFKNAQNLALLLLRAWRP